MAREYDHLFKLLIIGDSGKGDCDRPMNGREGRLVPLSKAWSVARQCSQVPVP